MSDIKPFDKSWHDRFMENLRKSYKPDFFAPRYIPPKQIDPIALTYGIGKVRWMTKDQLKEQFE